MDDLMNVAEATAADRWWNLQSAARRVAIRRWLDSPDGHEATQVEGQLSITDAADPMTWPDPGLTESGAEQGPR